MKLFGSTLLQYLSWLCNITFNIVYWFLFNSHHCFPVSKNNQGRIFIYYDNKILSSDVYVVTGGLLLFNIVTCNYKLNSLWNECLKSEFKEKPEQPIFLNWTLFWRFAWRLFRWKTIKTLTAHKYYIIMLILGFYVTIFTHNHFWSHWSFCFRFRVLGFIMDCNP